EDDFFPGQAGRPAQVDQNDIPQASAKSGQHQKNGHLHLRQPGGHGNETAHDENEAAEENGGLAVAVKPAFRQANNFHCQAQGLAGGAGNESLQPVHVEEAPQAVQDDGPQQGTQGGGDDDPPDFERGDGGHKTGEG